MKAFTRTKYGPPEALQLTEIPMPTLKDAHVIVKVMANSVNPVDWHIIRGTPRIARLGFGWPRPRHATPGADFAGIVHQVGPGVSSLKPGDRVFGESLHGAFAEYLCLPEQHCALMPENASFTEMACLPIAGLTALQALITLGQIREGESVLINGASGGVGHFTVQIAKALGAIVTGVCSERNAAFVNSLGADHVIPYDKADIHRHPGKYDLVIDTNGNLRYSDFKRMGRRGVNLGFTSIGNMASVVLKTALGKFPLRQFTARVNKQDLETLATLIRDGKIKVHIEKTYSHSELPLAVRHIEAMRTRGKVAVEWK